MEKSYVNLVHRRTQRVAATEEVAAAVSTAVAILRRHSTRGVICLRCSNDNENNFTVTDIDEDSHSITEIGCKR